VIVGPDGAVVVMTIVGMCLLLVVVMLRRQRRERLGPWAVVALDLGETAAAAVVVILGELKTVLVWLKDWVLTFNFESCSAFRHQAKILVLILAKGVLEMVAIWVGMDPTSVQTRRAENEQQVRDSGLASETNEGDGEDEEGSGGDGDDYKRPRGGEHGDGAEVATATAPPLLEGEEHKRDDSEVLV